MNQPTNRQLLEQRLLQSPFDVALRFEYAELLLDEADHPNALAQAELLCQQQPAQANPRVLQARCLLAAQRHAEALTSYMKARPLEGFEAVDELESLSANAQSSRGPHLQVVGGKSAPAEVVPIQQPPQEKIRFSSIVGMEGLKKTIRLKIIEPYRNPGLFARFRAQSGGGILLYGPPGCGKTMMARAIANECDASFVSVGISDVLNMWLGESERNLAVLFEKARAEQPCVLFFDELDALAYSRAKAGSASARTVVNEFLAQLDGVGRDNKGVLILAATNMPWDVDSAMKRPGRFSRQIFVPPPDLAARAEMFRIKLTGVPTDDSIDSGKLAVATEHYSGADIDGLIELAKESALADNLSRSEERPLQGADFSDALRDMQPSTLDWLRTVRNVVKYAGEDATYKEVESYLKQTRML
jgi:transitional endoplasmic reticulum ATPase